MKNTNRFKLFGLIALAAVIVFSACPVDGNTGIDTSDLNAVILEAGLARDGVVTASSASEVPTGKKWVSQSVWDTLDDAYKAAVETKANPSSQSAVNTAKANLQTALTAFNAAKQEGSAAAIKLSGTITIKNNGQVVPYVRITARTEDWSKQESVRISSTEANSPWEIIAEPFSSPTDIVFTIAGYDNDKYENVLFSYTIDDFKKSVYNTDVPNITINLVNLKLITISGTLNLDYNGKEIPSGEIAIDRKADGYRLGMVSIYKARNNAPWSVVMEAQESDTDVKFNIVGFDGPIPWEYDQLFALWGQDFGIKVGNQNKSGIALNLITISGTVSVTSIPTVEIHINASDWAWIANTTLKNPPANTPWSIVLPAYTSNTEIRIGIVGKDEDETELFARWGEITKTVKNTNVSGIALNFITISGTVNITRNGEPFPYVRISVEKKVGDTYEWIDSTLWEAPPAYTSGSIFIPAFTSDTEIRFVVAAGDDPDSLPLRWVTDTITVKNTNITGLELDVGDITEDIEDTDD
ncbi:MAG: hypothetical protein LBC52_02120 [Treponema sp.]|jgi:hypothetical protein|nr:hypothetical protein [Treponema sp.]